MFVQAVARVRDNLPERQSATPDSPIFVNVGPPVEGDFTGDYFYRRDARLP